MAKKNQDNSLIGAAGVHYAAYRLTRKGMLALPTVRNTPGTDLIVTSRDGKSHANIQVKTSQYERAKFWIICSAKKFAELPFGENDYYLLLRPRRKDDHLSHSGADENNELEGFLLTANEAKQEMQVHLAFKTQEGTEGKFPLCIWVDKGKREQSWPENKDGVWIKNKEKWREAWQKFEI